jgi:hypothetical protein
VAYLFINVYGAPKEDSGVVPAVGGPIWDNWPVDFYTENKSSLTVLSVLFGTKLDFNFESSPISHADLTSGRCSRRQPWRLTPLEIRKK